METIIRVRNSLSDPNADTDRDPAIMCNADPDKDRDIEIMCNTDPM